MSRLELAKIPSLTFYQGAHTAARRTSALPQLVCKGKPCSVFQPEAVRCVNLGGGVGTDVDWKCEADLPDSLRFGKVEVSCEGWSKAGDPYVLKGSCSLEYRLVQVPGSLRNTDSPIFDSKSYDLSTIIFAILWVGALFFFAYHFFLSCFRGNAASRGPSRPTNSNSPPRSSGGGGGWFPGDYRNYPSGPPPPYSKTADDRSGWSNWTPGFWTGAAVGGLANQLWNRNTAPATVRTSTYDWERPRTSFWNRGITTQRQTSHDDDRGEGSSNLGSMRRSTGLGGSNVR